jgi:hypothetical protein
MSDCATLSLKNILGKWSTNIFVLSCGIRFCHVVRSPGGFYLVNVVLGGNAAPQARHVQWHVHALLVAKSCEDA